MRALALLLLVGCGGPGLTRTQPPPKTPTVTSTPSPTPSSTATTYEDPDGQFSLTFPAAFEAKRSSENIEKGTMAVSSISTTTNDTRYLAVKLVLDNVAYDCAKGLDGMRDQTMDREKCTLTSEKNVEVKGNAAREVQFDCSNGRRAALLLVCDASKAASKHHTVYDLSATGPNVTLDTQKPFFGSFVLK